MPEVVAGFFQNDKYKLPVVITMLILVKHIPDVIYNINAL